MGVRGLTAFVVCCVVWALALLSVARPPAVETEVLAASIRAEPESITVAPTLELGRLGLPDITTSSSIAFTTTSTATLVVQSESVAPVTIPAVDSSAPSGSVADSVPVTTAAPESIGESALDLVHYDWEGNFPNWRITFSDGRAGLRALTYPTQKRIEIFVRNADTPQTLHRVIAHELGHVVDLERNTPEERDSWIAQRGITRSTPWWPGDSAPDFSTGAGDFAEAFAEWETGVQSQSTVAGQPDVDDLRFLVELVNR